MEPWFFTLPENSSDALHFMTSSRYLYLDRRHLLRFGVMDTELNVCHNIAKGNYRPFGMKCTITQLLDRRKNNLDIMMAEP